MNLTLKNLIIASSIALAALIACTPKSMENNKHDEAPVYEQSARIQPQQVESIEQVEQLYHAMRPAIESGDEDRVFSALEAMEVYLLNLENLTNPVINTRGNMHTSYTRLMNLYGLGMTVALQTLPQNERMQSLLTNYRNTIFHSCHLDNMDCYTAAAFKGSYGVTILAHLIRQDIQRLEDAEQSTFELQTIKNVIFSLYVLKNFDENLSNVTQTLFIDFSAIFFRSVDIANIEDALLNKYLIDMQNMMVHLAAQDAAPETCSIFQSMNRHQLNHIAETLDRGFVAQFNNHYNRCHTSEEIIARIVADENDNKTAAIRDVDNRGPWAEFRNNIHARTYILQENHSNILSNFGISGDIPLSTLHVMDQVYYGRMDVTEREALLERLSEEDLETLVRKTEQYAQINFLYAMQYTFNQFNNSLQASYEANGTINKKFVQDVYDALWESTGDMWIDYRRRVGRLRQGLSDVFYKLPDEKRTALEPLFDELNEKKLEDISVTNLVNVGVTYPIVLATTYFTGVDGGGTMEIRVTWARGADNTIEISTVKPLRNYFMAYTRNILQLLDFGTIGYQPYRFERSYGLAAAIKSGFFDTVNLDLGQANQGLEHNLELFWERYVENNREFAEIAQREIEELRTIEENHWPKVQNLCQNPINSERKIEMGELYQDFYLDSRESSSSVAEKDLAYATRINTIQTYVETLRKEIQKMQRTYQVILNALQEQGHDISNIKGSLQKELVPHFQTMHTLISKRKNLLKDVQNENESCLYTLNRMQRFQQNVMQKKSVDYATYIHAAMSYAVADNPLYRRAAVLSSATEIKELFAAEKARIEASENPDSYSLWVCDQMITSSVLEKVNSQLNFSGQRLLTEALNLIVSPHNMDTDFGYIITGMTTRGSSLDDPDSFLARRGGFDDEYFEISPQDQQLRVREELLSLTVKASELARYFSDSPAVMAELRQFGYDGSETTGNIDIPLSSNLEAFINNFRYFKDQLGTPERKRTRVRYQTNRLAFVQEVSEKLFGNHYITDGNQIFNWSSQYSRVEYLGQYYSKNIDTYIGGPVFVPEILENLTEENSNIHPEDVNLSCILDSSFDDLSEKEGCVKYAIQPKQVIDEFIQRSEFFYLERDELAPMLTVDAHGQLDELSTIVDQTLLNSYYIDQYKPSSILSYFRYYKRKLEPENWTWFDQFLAKEFTTVSARDQQHQSLNVPLIPGTTDYRFYFEEVEDLEFEKLLLTFNQSTEKVFRNFFRAGIFNFISFTDGIMDEMTRREYQSQAEDFPLISFKREDVADISAGGNQAREWLTMEIDTRSNGSLILLGDHNYETKVYEDQQKVVLEEYECSLLPEVGDLDYDTSAAEYINRAQSGQEPSCELKVRRWLNYKKCQQFTRRENELEGYHRSCISELAGSTEEN